VADVKCHHEKICTEGELVEQIKYSMNNELVSSDIVGTAQPAFTTVMQTIVSKDGKHRALYLVR
jgi:glyceraldehyde 3-phosphate dehydrogenase